MNKKLISRVIKIADYIENSKCTIREAAKEFHISKSTVHKDMTERLMEIDTIKYEKIDDIFKNHLQVRHIRGGKATKDKYLKLKLKT